MHGVKETKEVLVAANEVALALVVASKDGLDLSDGLALVGNAKVKEALMVAADSISKVPAEVKDLDLGEGLELAQVQLAYVPKYVEALK